MNAIVRGPSEDVRRHVVVPKIILGRQVPGDTSTDILLEREEVTIHVPRFTRDDCIAIRTATDALRDELVTLTMAEVTMFLRQVGEHWISVDGPGVAAIPVVSALTGYSVEAVGADFEAISNFVAHRAYGYDLVASELGSERALDEWQSIQASRVKFFPRGLVIHGLVGNIPMAGLFSLVRGLLTRNVNVAKLPSRDLLSVTSFVEAMIQAAPDHPLTRATSVAYWEHDDPAGAELFAVADAAALWGGDEAIRAMRAQLPAGIPITEFGPRRSLAVIDLTACDPVDAAARLASDVSRHDQHACFSSQAALVLGDVADFQETLDASLAVAARRVPPVPMTIDEYAKHSYAHLEALWDGCSVQIGRGWSSILCHDLARVDHPLARTVLLQPFQSMEEVARHLDRWVQTVATFPWERFEPELDRWACFGPVRFVELGLSEHPRKGFSHDGILPVAGLVRRVSLEGAFDEVYKYLDALPPLRVRERQRFAYPSEPSVGDGP